MRISFSLFSFVAMLIFSCKEKASEPKIDCSSVSHTYATDIKPIVDSRCSMSGCHNAGSPNGDYTYFAGIKAKAENGSLRDRVVIKKDMPTGKPLSAEEIAKFECWIKEGALEN